VTRGEKYLLDNQQVEAGQRFDALSVLFNPSTFRHTQSLGLTPGWRVWEVGAGSPSVPAHFAEQVGPQGHVLATDIDTSWLESADATYEVLRHDVGLEPPPPGFFDLVHARLAKVVNYGWSVYEGSHSYKPSEPLNRRGKLVRPIYQYGHVNGNCAIAGGYVYRGSSQPALRGRYFFGDNCSGAIW